MLKNTERHFGIITKTLHWMLFILLSTQFTLGTLYALAQKNTPQKLEFITWHKSVGLTIFIVALCFLLWNHINIRPQSAQNDPNWKRIIAKIVQHTMVLLIILTPILGYALSCSAGYLVHFFDWYTLPCFFQKNDVAAEIFEKIHITLGLTLFGLIVLHILAALHHHFILKDNVLKRMLPFGKF